MSESHSSEGISRRKFVKTITLGAAGVAVAATGIKPKEQSVKAENNSYVIEPEGLRVNSLPTSEPETIIESETITLNETSNQLLLQEIENRTREYELNTEESVKFTSEQYNTPITPHTDVGYLRSFYSWYLDGPEKITKGFLTNDCVNPEDFYLWANGNLPKNPEKKSDPITDQVEILYNVDDPPQRHLASLAKNVLNTIVVNDKNRVRQIQLSDMNATSPSTGDVYWDMFGAYATLPENLYGMQSLIHEIIHATAPNFRKQNGENPQDKFRLAIESGTLPAMLEFYKTWNNTYVDNFDFFKKRFYDAEGDGTLAMVKEGNMGGIDSGAMPEFIAMLCTDFVLPSKDGIPLEEWPENVVSVVATTWNFVRHGNASEFKPMEIDEVITMRQELLKHYATYLKISTS